MSQGDAWMTKNGIKGLEIARNNKKVSLALIQTDWPFPPATGPMPWTNKQKQAYAKQQREEAGEAPL